MSDEKVKAKLGQISGKVKETIGKVSGDKSLETEGKVEKTSGKLEEFAADAKILSRDFQMVSKKINKGDSMTVNDIKSTLTYDDKVIEKIVGHALEEVDGLLAVSGGFFSNLKKNVVNSNSVTDGVHVEVGSKEVAVDLDVIVEYGKDIPKIADAIKEIVAKNVDVMTHLNVVEVNVNVVDIRTKEEQAQAEVTVQDKVSNAANSTSQFVSSKTEQMKEAVSNSDTREAPLN